MAITDHWFESGVALHTREGEKRISAKQEPTLRLWNLQLQRHCCSRLGRISK
jgi:DNA-directed RNA polymerase subunit N (RpoN/RPB10)